MSTVNHRNRFPRQAVRMKAIQNKLRDRVNGIGVRAGEYTSEVESRGAYLVEPTKTREWDRPPLHNASEEVNGIKDHKSLQTRYTPDSLEQRIKANGIIRDEKADTVIPDVTGTEDNSQATSHKVSPKQYEATNTGHTGLKMHMGVRLAQFLTGEVTAAWLTSKAQGGWRGRGMLRHGERRPGPCPAEQHGLSQQGDSSKRTPARGRQLSLQQVVTLTTAALRRIARLRPGPAARPPAWHQTPPL
ncbi:hypothetical protein QYF61_026590 [Mycteria americana]|uniref:Uncharacterized protein n=1 Tax=Mycteria americana TaxID=33587 RepID=A0AAN7NJ50_MYCAM|nr:hypothetical protein QYF61_026590 [Mycteria americana]